MNPWTWSSTLRGEVRSLVEKTRKVGALMHDLREVDGKLRASTSYLRMAIV
jgi:hypothetical protein